MQLPWVSRDLYNARALQVHALQDDLRTERDETSYLRQELDKARADATRSREIVANWLAEHTFGKPIYNAETPTLAESTYIPTAEIDWSPRPTARAQAQKMTNEFFKSYEAAKAAIRPSSPVVDQGTATDSLGTSA